MNTKPKPSELNHALGRLVNWQNFALHLPGIDDYSIISTIEKDYPKDNETAKRKMLEKWLSLDDNATWSSVVAALKKAREYALAESVRRYVSSLPAVSTTTASTNTATQNVVITGQSQTQPTTGHTQREATESASTGQGQTQPTTGNTQREATESANTGQGQTQSTTGRNQNEATDGTSTGQDQSRPVAHVQPVPQRGNTPNSPPPPHSEEDNNSETPSYIS